MKLKKTELGDWEPRKQYKDLEPNELRDTNRTLWIVAGGGVAIFLMIVISFFTAAHFFPSLFFFGSENTAAVMEGEEITIEEFQYYLIQAAEEEKHSNPDYHDKKQANTLKSRALELMQTDRLYPLLTEKLELIPQADTVAKKNQLLNEYETARNTPLFQFQMQSRGLTEELARALIVSESAKETLEEYALEHTDSGQLLTRAQEIFVNSYRKCKWIRFSLTDSGGNPLPQKEAEKVRAKCYSIYQQLQSGESFQTMQQSLVSEPQIWVYDQLVTKGQMLQEAEEVVFSLEVNETGGPVETEQDIFLIQRVDSREDFAGQEQAMVYLAWEQLFDEWMDSYRQEYSIKPYRKNLKKFDVATFLEQYYEQKQEADKQIQWMEQSK